MPQISRARPALILCRFSFLRFCICSCIPSRFMGMGLTFSDWVESISGGPAGISAKIFHGQKMPGMSLLDVLQYDSYSSPNASLSAASSTRMR